MRNGFNDIATDFLYSLIQEFISNRLTKNHELYSLLVPNSIEENASFYDFVIEYFDPLYDLLLDAVQNDRWDLRTRLWVAETFYDVEMWLPLLFGNFDEKISGRAYDKVLDLISSNNSDSLLMSEWLISKIDIVINYKKTHRLINLLLSAYYSNPAPMLNLFEELINMDIHPLSTRIIDLLTDSSTIDHATLDLLTKLAGTTFIDPSMRIKIIRNLVMAGYRGRIEEILTAMLKDNSIPNSIKNEIDAFTK
jgi:hypothetical protein